MERRFDAVVVLLVVGEEMVDHLGAYCLYMICVYVACAVARCIIMAYIGSKMDHQSRIDPCSLARPDRYRTSEACDRGAFEFYKQLFSYVAIY